MADNKCLAAVVACVRAPSGAWAQTVFLHISGFASVCWKIAASGSGSASGSVPASA